MRSESTSLWICACAQGLDKKQRQTLTHIYADLSKLSSPNIHRNRCGEIFSLKMETLKWLERKSSCRFLKIFRWWINPQNFVPSFWEESENEKIQKCYLDNLHSKKTFFSNSFLEFRRTINSLSCLFAGSSTIKKIDFLRDIRKLHFEIRLLPYGLDNMTAHALFDKCPIKSILVNYMAMPIKIMELDKLFQHLLKTMFKNNCWQLIWCFKMI